MLITISILIYLVFGLFDAIRFRSEHPNSNNIECVMAIVFTPIFRLGVFIIKNLMLSIIICLIIYLIMR